MHTKHSGENGSFPIAIIGMGCRFPGADGPGSFWNLLRENIDAVSPVPPDRYDVSAVYDPTPATAGRTVSRHGGFLEDPYGFDAAFFGISPVEAKSMDPQQRLLLHVTWEALEAAGIPPSSLAGTRTGVFIGQATSEYAEVTRPAAGSSVWEATGSRIRAITAGRISYTLDLRGPSMVVDTACSSSLVALHAARQSLLTGDSELAIAGGVNIVLSPEDSIAYSQGGMLSPQGRCRFGSAEADGFVRSDGVGVVVLKPLHEALRGGDPVLAVLLGSVVTNDGRGSGLLLKPSAEGQADMLRQACRSAGIEPWQLDYVEAHGTGTPVGDGVELQALSEAALPGRPAGRPLKVGSVKTNIGHAEAAAGMAGLIKAVLIARHGIIPASLHQGTPHPLLADGTSPIEVVTANEPVEKAGRQALLGISSFGLSGTNAHAVIGEYLPAPDRPADNQRQMQDGSPHLLVLSARSDTALRKLAKSFAEYLSPEGNGRAYALRDVCAAAATRRDAHPYRLWVTGDSRADVSAKLRSLASGESIEDGGIAQAGFNGVRRAVFVFPGQGSQWLGMGRDLMASSPAFHTALERCDRAIRAELGWSVIGLFTSDAEEFPAEVELVQPALWAMQVALAAAWQEKGIDPDVCVGHSMGEVAAAHVAGALSLEDAAAVICRRSQLMKRAAGRGAMLAVELSADEARLAISRHADNVCIAAENAPTSTIIAGDRTALAQIEAELRSRGVLCQLVKVNVASHSPHMDALREHLLDQLADLEPTASTTDMISTVHDRRVRGPELDGRYWADNLRRPVRFATAVKTLGIEAESVFLEVSPHPVLVTSVEETLSAWAITGAAMPSLRRDRDERVQLMQAVGRLFAHGGHVAWDRWYGEAVRPVALPPYPWDSKQFRPDAVSTTGGKTCVREVSLAALTATGWDDAVQLRGIRPIPAAVYLATLLNTASEAMPGAMLALEDMELGDELVDAHDADRISLRITLKEADGRSSRPALVEAVHNAGPGPIRCATGLLRTVDGADTREAHGALDAALARCRHYLPASGFRTLARRRGLEIGEAFEGVEQLWRRDGEAVARLRLPKAGLPAAWETGLHPLVAAWPLTGAQDADSCTYVATGFDRVQLFGDLTEEFWSISSFTPASGTDPARGNVVLLTREGRVLAELTGIRLRRLAGEAVREASVLSAVISRLSRLTLPVGASPGNSMASLLGRLISRPDRSADGAAPPRARHVRAASPVSCERSQIRATRTGTGRGARTEPPQSSRSADADTLLRNAAAVLGMAVTDIDLRRPFRDYGLDSLMAAQLRQRLRKETGLEVTAGRLLGADSIGSIARSLADDLLV
ncbi:acyltransferase domain-containing protein [Streptomyces sp. RB6PN25]|uniref:Acyltransferase domain-containing protein n=1 Tax=Streptomyces humicola TaxID=2953240 RepID=A0ABT1PQ18_9ACTN|nr:type I polyketide synthase [Streptomyces humicola]MCQ4079761.1 acyltransferase domain-containing protein [Streptomyces humicola]